MKKLFYTTLSVCCLGSASLLAQSNTCAKVKSIEGNRCEELKVSFDLSACAETQKGPVEVKCQNNLASAAVFTDNSIYTAQFQGEEAWGKTSFKQVGEVKKSGALQKNSKTAPTKKAMPIAKKENLKPAAVEEKSPPADQPLSISGTFDAFYSYNFNRPGVVTQPLIGAPAGNSSYRAYDSYHNSFGLNLAELTIKKTSGEIGFLADIDFGQQVEQNHPGSGSLTVTNPNNTTTTYSNIAKVDEVSKHIGQAYITYTPQWGNGLSFNVGKLYTHVGYEVTKAKDNWQYSRSYTFWYAMPVWHLGVSASMPLYEDKISASVYLYNGWNNLYENNSGKTLGAQLKITPNPDFTFIYNVIAGPEKNKNNSDWKIVNEANALWNATSDLSFAIEGLAGYEAKSAPGGSKAAKWFGTSLHSKWTATDWYWVSPRFEFYRDQNGYTLATSKPESVFSGTLTNAFPVGSGFEVRAEGRVDGSKNSKLYVTHKGTNSRYQTTLTLGVLFSF